MMQLPVAGISQERRQARAELATEVELGVRTRHGDLRKALAELERQGPQDSPVRHQLALAAVHLDLGEVQKARGQEPTELWNADSRVTTAMRLADRAPDEVRAAAQLEAYGFAALYANRSDVGLRLNVLPHLDRAGQALTELHPEWVTTSAYGDRVAPLLQGRLQGLHRLETQLAEQLLDRGDPQAKFWIDPLDGRPVDLVKQAANQAAADSMFQYAGRCARSARTISDIAVRSQDSRAAHALAGLAKTAAVVVERTDPSKADDPRRRERHRGELDEACRELALAGDPRAASSCRRSTAPPCPSCRSPCAAPGTNQASKACSAPTPPTVASRPPAAHRRGTAERQGPGRQGLERRE